jgi:hypothetical protein
MWNDGLKKRKNASIQYVICIDNSDYPVSLDRHKIYEIMPDERAAEDNCLRVIDEMWGAIFMLPSALFRRFARAIAGVHGRRVREAAVISETPEQKVRSTG